MKFKVLLTYHPVFYKPLLVMKLTVFILLCSALQVSAKSFGQEKLTINLNNVEISSALNTIEKSSHYRFLYNSNLPSLKNVVTISVKDSPLEAVLKQLFINTNLAYQLMDKNLVIIKEQQSINVSINNSNVKAIISGRVADSTGKGIAGVSVQVKGTSKGTVTGPDGSFSIDANSTDVLVISYVGYDTQEVPVGSNTNLIVTIRISNSQLEQVVVIGYGTAQKRDLTGSITSVAGKEVADKPNSNPVGSLQGKVTGLSVVNNGTPGAQPDIRIRGTVSIGQVRPLYVVDGILNDNIDYLNPNDIQSIEVLKDASSLAIFGVRGATGAIVITTKKAKAGQTIVNLTSSYGFKKLVDKIDLVDSSGFSLLYKEENDNNSSPTPIYSYLTANTDWIDAVTRTGQFSNSNLSVSGGSDKNKFNIGFGYIYDEGIIKHEKLQRMTLNFSDEFKVYNDLKIGVNLNAVRSNNPFNVTGSGANSLDNARKVIPQVSDGTQPYQVKNPYGTDTITQNLYSSLSTPIQSGGVVNPLLQLENEWNKTVNIEYRTVGSVYADWTFFKHLNFRSTFYADISNIDYRKYTPLYYAYNPVDKAPFLYSQNTQVEENNQTFRKFQQDEILTYTNKFGLHGLTATAGFTTYYFGNFNRGGTARPSNTPGSLPIPDDDRFWYINSGFQNNPLTLATSSQNEYTTASVLARVLYNYAGKYFINASFRNDASSQIPTKNRNQQFWAVGAAWDVAKENFMANQKIFSYLKLKGSVGVLGNQSAVDNNGVALPYPFYPRLNTASAAIFGNNVYNAANTLYDANPNLKWETVEAIEGGIELNAFDNRLHFEGNYYTKKTKNLMTFVDRSEIGKKSELINGGTLKNWGEELLASWNQSLSKDLTVSISGNITFLNNKVLALSEELPTGVLIRGFQNNGSAESRTQAGQPIGSFFGYIQEGVFQSYADILKSPVQSSLGAIRPGDIKFKDISGPDGVPDGKIDANDRTFIGNPTPDFIYGTSVSISYKGFSLIVEGNGVYGNEIFRTWGSLESPFQRVNYAAFQLNRWHGEGTSNFVPIISQGDRANYNGSTYNMEDGSYFRLRNIQLSYSLPSTMINSWHVKGLRFYANAQNIKTWKNNLGYTAEYGGDATAFGYDNAGGAIPVVVTFGFNATF